MDHQLFNKCIRCKRTDVKIENFTYLKRTMKLLSGTDHFKNIIVPVCEDCKKKFSTYSTLEYYYDKLKTFLITVSICFYIYAFVVTIFTIPYFFFLKHSSWVKYLVPFIIPISITVIIIILNYLIKKSSYSVRKYIDITSNGKIKVKDKEIQQIIAEKIETELIKRIEAKMKGEDIIFCPKCGIQCNIFTDFCTSCGKDLRTLELRKKN